MLITTRNWNSTDSENENIAKDAVLISIPRNVITHWSEALLPLPLVDIESLVMCGAVHGVVRSLSKTPFSRASCSRVMGMNEPIYH